VTPTTSTAHESVHELQGVYGRPTLIIVDSHIAWDRRTSTTRTRAWRATRRRRDPATKRCVGWPENAKFLVGTVQTTSAAASAPRAAAAGSWFTMLGATGASIRRSPTSSIASNRRELPDGLDELPTFERDAKGPRGRDASARSERRRARGAVARGGSAEPLTLDENTAHVRRAGDLGPTTPGARNMHFGIRKHAMAGRPERPRGSRSYARSGRRSSPSATTRGRDPARGDHRASRDPHLHA